MFGRRLDDVWNDWIAFEHEYQKANLAKLAQYPLTETVKLSPTGLGSISRGFVDPKTNSLIAAFRYPGTIGFIGRMDLATGKLTKLQEIKGMMLYKVTSVAFDPDCADGLLHRRQLRLPRPHRGRTSTPASKRMLLKDARIGDMVVNPADKSIWGIRHENGFATIVRIPPPYAGFNQVHTFKYGQIPFDLDISPDGTMISASFGEINGDPDGARVEDSTRSRPTAIRSRCRALALPPATPEGFVFAPDGKTLYGTSYYTGVSNVFRFDIAAGQV